MKNSTRSPAGSAIASCNTDSAVTDEFAVPPVTTALAVCAADPDADPCVGRPVGGAAIGAACVRAASAGGADTTPAATPSATPPIITSADIPSAMELCVPDAALLTPAVNVADEAPAAMGGGAGGAAGGSGADACCVAAACIAGDGALSGVSRESAIASTDRGPSIPRASAAAANNRRAASPPPGAPPSLRERAARR